MRLCSEAREPENVVLAKEVSADRLPFAWGPPDAIYWRTAPGAT
jgi:hypothetical protein